ncbi:MAG: hypothetical protein Kow006_21820 [Gammaproteobacteria bacterium]
MGVRVVLTSIGRFHLFDLARELHRRGMLERIFTGYPRWKLETEKDIPQEKIGTFPWLQTLYMGMGRFGINLEGMAGTRLARWAHDTLDRYVAGNLPECEVFLALSGSGLHSGRLAQRRGAAYVCDRGSSHIRYQDSILREEFQRWGDQFQGIDPVMMAREEAEYETADAITVPSTFAYRSFVESGVPADRLRLVPYGVNLQRFGKAADPDPDRFEVLFVGQVGYRKGVPYLLEAFRRLRHPKKRLRIVGTLQAEMKRYLARCPPPEGVVLTGAVPQEALRGIMSRAHVMVLPSIEEGLALVQAQALACGCPVIATPHTGAEDLFTDSREGFIVPIRSAEAIAEKLQLLADDPDRRVAMSEAALRRVAEIGGWNAYGERMAAVLREPVGADRAH